MPSTSVCAALLAVMAATPLAACGASSSPSTSSSPAAPGSSSPAPGASSTATAASQAAGAGALSAEVRAAATGDIPDTQIFLTYTNKSGGYSITYPEGWAERPTGTNVVFSDKNNVIRVLVSHGPKPTPASVAATLKAEKVRQSSLAVGAAVTRQIGGVPVIKVSYSTISAANPVTGKRIQLLVDRYVYDHNGRVAILDLATPKGVDNVDAYKRIALSWKWR
ncbi:MAG TPA: PsbP-related protein [Solirubrobacteraceae bacterium]